MVVLYSIEMELVAIERNTSRLVFRYAFGIALIVAIAMGMGWNLAFLLPVLSLGFLAAGDTVPSLKQGVLFVLMIAIANLVGLVLSYTFLGIPAIHIMITFLILLHLFYTRNRLFGPMVKVWLIIAILLIPNVALLSKGLATVMSITLTINATLAILLIWLIYFLIPVKEKNNPKAAAENNGIVESPTTRFYTALTTTLVIMPVYLLFYYFELSGSILILIFIAILSMQPGFAKDFKGGKALILGNLIGGMAAILAYEVLTVMPVFSYFVMLVILFGLLFGIQVFSGKKAAPLFGMAFSTFLLIICSVTEAGSNDAGSKLWSRVFQIMVAVIYVVTAFGVIDRFKKSVQS